MYKRQRYYKFNDVDIVPYKLNGRLSAVFVAPREMDKSNMEESAQSYANQVFRYTHGFGAVASPINRVTAEGQPEFYIKDIPPKSSEGMPEITQPRIYYGELTNCLLYTSFLLYRPASPEYAGILVFQGR